MSVPRKANSESRLSESNRLNRSKNSRSVYCSDKKLIPRIKKVIEYLPTFCSDLSAGCTRMVLSTTHYFTHMFYDSMCGG